MDTIAQAKACRKCGVSKPFTEFRRDASRRDGVSSRCKHCVSVPPKPLADRFCAKVDKTGAPHPTLGTPCWPWTGSGTRRGYGQIQVEGRKVLAHRLAYEIAHGPIADGLCVLHRCDNPPCVNDAHLFLGTHAVNHADMRAKGRQHCGEAHLSAKLTEDAVRVIRAESSRGTLGVDLARRFGVTPAAITKVVRGTSWRHVAATEANASGRASTAERSC